MQQTFRVDRPLGYQQLTIDATTAQALTSPVGAMMCRITATAQAIRIRDDGTDPTSTVGYPVAVNTEWTYAGGLAALKIIGQTASAVVNVLYYGQG